MADLICQGKYYGMFTVEILYLQILSTFNQNTQTVLSKAQVL